MLDVAALIHAAAAVVAAAAPAATVVAAAAAAAAAAAVVAAAASVATAAGLTGAAGGCSRTSAVDPAAYFAFLQSHSCQIPHYESSQRDKESESGDKGLNCRRTCWQNPQLKVHASLWSSISHQSKPSGDLSNSGSSGLKGTPWTTFFSPVCGLVCTTSRLVVSASKRHRCEGRGSLMVAALRRSRIKRPYSASSDNERRR